MKIFGGVLGVLLLLAAPASAGVIATKETLGRDISVCFVGDAVTKRADRVKQVLEWIKDFEVAANIRFRPLGACPPPKTLPNGDEVYEGDVRIVIPNTSVDATVAVPGKQCPRTDNKGWGSWGTFPDAAKARRYCLFTVKLGDDPWRGEPYRNHTLHEVGHALGLAHEHQRYDFDPTVCDGIVKYFGSERTAGLATLYDPESVMHYTTGPHCKVIGNYARNGLSEKDKLTLHMMYPEDVRVAEFVGNTVVLDSENLWLMFGWKRRGAIVPNVASGFQWKIDGKPVGEKDNLDVKVAPGVHTLEYSYKDYINRAYAYKGTVRVLTKDDFTRTIAAPLAARAVLQ